MTNTISRVADRLAALRAVGTGSLRNDEVAALLRPALLSLLDLGAARLDTDVPVARWRLTPLGLEVLERAELAAYEAAWSEVSYRLG